MNLAMNEKRLYNYIYINSFCRKVFLNQNVFRKFLGGNRDYPDDLPTRDIGPDRLIGHSSNHSEIGIPISTTQDNRSRYIAII